MKSCSACLLSLFWICLTGVVYADEDYMEARRLAEEGRIQSLEAILESIQRKLRGNILEAEFERDGSLMIYEIEMLDEGGRVWELKVDAVSGEILERELED